MPKTVNLTWNNSSSGITEQLVERSVTDGAFVQIGTTPPDQNSFIDNVDEFVDETKLSYKVSSNYIHEGTAYSASSSIIDIVINQSANIPDSDFTKVTYIKTDTSNPMWIEAKYAPENVNGKLHIDWGDGAKEVLNIADFAADKYYIYLEHEYAVNGEYVVKVYSTTKANYTGFGEITKVTDWGSPSNLQPYFSSVNLIEVPSTLHPDLTSLRNMFSGATSFNQDISGWGTSNVTDMRNMFRDCTLFNQPLNNWDVSNVTDMYAMFWGATSFNGDVSGWDTSKVTNMGAMFRGCSSFNQDISNWNVRNVTDMRSMFSNATSFNQPIGNWDVSNVTDMNGMFSNAIAFNQDISGWNVSNVINMAEMFRNATSFNQDLSSWCVALITTMPTLFDGSASAWTLPRPVWGTCPRGENVV